MAMFQNFIVALLAMANAHVHADRIPDKGLMAGIVCNTLEQITAYAELRRGSDDTISVEEAVLAVNEAAGDGSPACARIQIVFRDAQLIGSIRINGEISMIVQVIVTEVYDEGRFVPARKIEQFVLIPLKDTPRGIEI
jgi:hypothetical protein